MASAAPFLILVAGAAALLYLDAQNQQADSTDTAPGMTDILNSSLGDLMGTSNPNANGFDANLSAFLYMLRMGESSNRYNVMYGGKTFSDYSHHPDVWVPIPSRPGYGSTAAGAYQFIYSTWMRFASELGLPDFSPASQDAAAAQYLQELGAMPAIEAGDLNGAIQAINGRGIVFESLQVRAYSQLAGWANSAGGAFA